MAAGERLRRRARSAWMRLATALRPERKAAGWIRFPYYHHVFDDEREGFAAQLRHFRNSGELIALDDAIALLAAPDPIPGRFFCLSFDDGFRNNLVNAVPILLDNGAVAAFFVPTIRVRKSRDMDDAIAVPHAGPAEPEYLTWGECSEMVNAGMTVGSHSVSHARLAELGGAALAFELSTSKATIESELQVPCLHFACPWGRPGIDFSPEREPAAARHAGYSSFLTTRRGSVTRRSNPFMVERDQVLANWPMHQLRYFFGR